MCTWKKTLHCGPSYFLVECEKDALVETVKALRTVEEAHLKLQGRTQLLEGQMADTQLLLNKGFSKYQSACRQQEVCVATSLQIMLKTIMVTLKWLSVFSQYFKISGYQGKTAPW